VSWVTPNGLGCNSCTGPSKGGLGGLDDLDGFPASGCNAYLSRVNVFFADATSILIADYCHILVSTLDILQLKRPEGDEMIALQFS